MVSDEQVAALRAFLALDADEAEFLTHRLVESNRLEGYGELVSAAFAAATRRRFSSGWKIADVIRIVASVRGRLINEGIEMDTRAAEVLMRRALGEKIAVELDEEVSARAQIFLLSELTLDEGLDDAELDTFLATARKLADRLPNRGRQA
jgi:hypothetical protein